MSDQASTRVNESENNAYHSKGATFTGNPRYTGPNEPIEEKPGHIASDSLASESMQSGGSFAANQSNIAASDQPSKGYSGNTTDTSGATVLPPTSEGTQRNDAESYMDPPETAQGTSSFATGATQSSTSSGAQQTSSSSSDDTSTSRSTLSDRPTTTATNAPLSANQAPTSSVSDTNASTAPSAYSGAGASDENLKPKPHGKNITEGGFEGNEPNASFNNDVGGENDPGRDAERYLQRGNAKAGDDAGYPGARQGADTSEGQGFERLGGDTEA